MTKREYLTRSLDELPSSSRFSIHSFYDALLLRISDLEIKREALGVPCDGVMELKRIRGSLHRAAINKKIPLRTEFDKSEYVLWVWVDRSKHRIRRVA